MLRWQKIKTALAFGRFRKVLEEGGAQIEGMRMKRLGYIIEQIVDKDNMNEAFDRVMRGTKRKRSRAGRRIIKNRKLIIEQMTDKIECDMYSIKGYQEFEVVEHGKLRQIQSVPLEDRIALHAIMSVVGGHIQKRLIRDTYAAIPRRGMHDGLKRINRALEEDPEGTKYCYKIDIKKFYQSIKQDYLIWILHRMFKDKRLLNTLERIIRVMDNGLSIGMRPSQDFGNLLLGDYLDHYIKDCYGVKYYYRYCDDIVILAGSKDELKPIAEKVHEHIESIELTIKENEQVFPVESRGIDFLGYVIRHSHVRVRKHIKQRFARKIKEVKSKRRRQELIASFYGFAKHADCNNLFLKLTGITMKSFSDFGVKWEPKDGKKRFEGLLVAIGDITNVPVVVLDFETDITTKQGEGRYLIHIEMDGVKKKFFTNSEEMKSILDQIRELPDGLPFETIIKRKVVGKGITKYEFT